MIQTTHMTTSGGLLIAAFIEAISEADARLPYGGIERKTEICGSKEERNRGR